MKPIFLIQKGSAMGLGCVLSEEIRFEGGKILDKNFDTYELPRFSRVAKIETVLVDNPIWPLREAPAITAMGAVIANAVYDGLGGDCLNSR